MIQHMDFGCNRSDNPMSDGMAFIFNKGQGFLETPSCWWGMTVTLFLVLLICNMMVGYRCHISR